MYIIINNIVSSQNIYYYKYTKINNYLFRKELIFLLICFKTLHLITNLEFLNYFIHIKLIQFFGLINYQVHLLNHHFLLLQFHLKEILKQRL